MRGYVEISPHNNYNWLNLPKDANITDVKYNPESNRIEIYFESESGTVYESNGDFGFEYIFFKENEDINITIEKKCEHREVIYSKIIKCRNRTLFIAIVKWTKV